MTVSKEEQPKKHHSPNSVTEEGMSIETREVQSLKHSNPILVTDFGITVSLQPAIIVLVAVSTTALQFSRESYMGLFASTIMAEREEP